MSRLITFDDELGWPLPKADFASPSRTIEVTPTEVPEPISIPEPEEAPIETPDREREPIPA